MLDQTTVDGSQANNGELTPFNPKDIVDPANYVDSFLFICTAIITFVGISINMLVIGAVVFIKRLHFPRIIGWIGVGISNIFVLVSRLMFVITAHWEPSAVSTRGFYTWFVFTSSLFLTSNIVSTVLERNICINYPKWHKRNITIRFIITFEFGMAFVVFLIPMAMANLEVFQPYLSSFFDSWNFKLVGTFFAIIFPVFLTGFVGFLAMFKEKTQQVTPVNSRRAINKVHLPAIGQLNDKNSKKGSAIADVKEKMPKHRTSHFVHVGNNRISELEVGAKETFHYLAYIYLMLMTPTLISFISVLICLQVSPSYYSFFMGAFYHIGVLMSCIHSGIANPVAFVLLSRDLLSCLKSRACQNKSVFKHDFQEDETTNPNKLEIICEEPDEETAV